MSWAATALSLLLCTTDPAACVDAPFEHASLLPNDVDIYLHIDHASRLRDEVGARPLGAAIERALAKSMFGEAWAKLADAATMSEGELFDHLVGTNLTLAFRKGEEGHDWIAITTIETPQWVDFVARVRPRLLRGIGAVPIRSLPEQRLLLARKDELVLIGPERAGAGRLFHDVLSSWAMPGAPRLAQDSGMPAAHDLGEGDAGLYIRHAGPLGGASAAVVNLGDQDLTVRHASRFESSPFGISPRPTTLDTAVFDRLSERLPCVIVHPLRVPPGSLATYIRSQMPQGAITRRLLDNLGERMIVALGDGPGGAMALSLAMEVRGSDFVLPDLDQFMIGLCTVMHRLARDEAAFPPDIIRQASRLPSEIREADITPWIGSVLPPLADVGPVTLHWASCESPESGWWLVSTDELHLERTVEALRTRTEQAGSEVDLVGQRGRVDGNWASTRLDGIARHLGAAVLRQGGDDASLLAVFGFVSDLARNVETCDWTTSIPGQNRLRSDWRLHLRSEGD